MYTYFIFALINITLNNRKINFLVRHEYIFYFGLYANKIKYNIINK